MNTWIVGKAPIGFYKRQAEAGPVEKTFFLKGRIMAGQADLKENQFGLKDFMWLTKQEIEKHVDGKFYHAIKNMMSDR
jgi:large subunit ribosomal protein L46